MCGKGLVSCPFKVCELFFQGRKVGAFNDVGDGLWFKPPS